jgi:LPXTG-site transpeptidase (sortase) family protein
MRAAACAVAVLIAAGSWLHATSEAGERPAAAPAFEHAHPVHQLPTTDPWDVRPTAPRYRPRAAVLAAPAPVRVAIPSIHVDSPLVTLGRGDDGVMEVPRDYATAGWYTGAPRPGENGPAVIAGHVDSRRGPAVFYDLARLRAGDRVTVDRADGSHAQFVVRSVLRYAKAAFPTAAVFGATTAPTLRLITCGGQFDRRRGHYLDNVVVFAALVGSGA